MFIIKNYVIKLILSFNPSKKVIKITLSQIKQEEHWEKTYSKITLFFKRNWLIMYPNKSHQNYILHLNKT